LKNSSRRRCRQGSSAPPRPRTSSCRRGQTFNSA
jgi:hypothetical protein